MALNGLICAEVPLKIYSLSHLLLLLPLQSCEMERIYASRTWH